MTEKETVEIPKSATSSVYEETTAQLSLFEEEPVVKEVTKPKLSAVEKEVVDQLKRLNVSGTTPMDALQLVYQLQQSLLQK